MITQTYNTCCPVVFDPIATVCLKLRKDVRFRICFYARGYYSLKNVKQKCTERPKKTPLNTRTKQLQRYYYYFCTHNEWMDRVTRIIRKHMYIQYVQGNRNNISKTKRRLITGNAHTGNICNTPHSCETTHIHIVINISGKQEVY